MGMADIVLDDAEFGKIHIKRSGRAGSAALKIGRGGEVIISLPGSYPRFFAKRILEQSRSQIRSKLEQISKQRVVLKHGDLIGKTHQLHLSVSSIYSSRLKDTTLRVTLPPDVSSSSREGQQYLRDAVTKALRAQAKAYLGRRLASLASANGFAYLRVRYSDASTRWGSCSSTGTISLNIWLMNLPFDLIDYVLIHELCHTRQQNHSVHFWALVEQLVPEYKECRRRLKKHSPSI
jgi:predicted metal-dependent hydrolase